MAKVLRSKPGLKVTDRQAGRPPQEHGPSFSDVAAHAITDRILRGRCVPGQRLIEGDLARELKVGRGTIREALKRLAAERVIVLMPHRGAFVRLLTRREALELQDVILALYSFVYVSAAARINEGDNRKRLTLAYEQLVAHGPQSDRIPHALDRSGFLDVIFSMCDNRELIRIIPAVMIQILRVQIYPFLTAKDLDELLTDYRLVYEAFIRGDAAKVKRLLEQHVARRRAQIASLPDEAFASEAL